MEAGKSQDMKAEAGTSQDSLSEEMQQFNDELNDQFENSILKIKFPSFTLPLFTNEVIVGLSKKTNLRRRAYRSITKPRILKNKIKNYDDEDDDKCNSDDISDHIAWERKKSRKTCYVSKSLFRR